MNNSKLKLIAGAFAAAASFAFLAPQSSAANLGTLQQELKTEQITEQSSDESIRPASSEAPVAMPAAGQAVGKVIAKYKLNVRRSPGGQIVGGLEPGALVMIMAREGEWYKIRYNGSFAYVHDSLVSIESGNPQVVGPWVKVPATGTVIAKYRMNVRKSPWGEIIGGLKPGERIEIVGCEGEWYIIQFEGGTAFAHCEMVEVDGSAAQEPAKPAQTETAEKPPTPETPEGPARPETPEAVNPPSPETPEQPSAPGKTGGINGPAIPSELKRGLEAAKRSEWMRSHKCLQFAGTVAHEAGAPEGKTNYTQAQSNWPADKSLRGYSINELPKAIEAGLLLPGMLVHVKIHYDKDPAYHVSDDAHHWFIYMGKDAQGVPRFADNTHKGNLQTADDVYRNMRGWENSKKYGDSKYGYIPRVTAVHDPFAGQR